MAGRWILFLGALLGLIPGIESGAAGQELTDARRIVIAARMAQSTVTITVRGRGASAGIGSGFVVGDEGWVVSNAHVVEGARRRPVTVHFPDGEVRAARVLVLDRRRDLAILEVEGGAPAPPLPLGDSDGVRVGQSVLAIGSPHGLSGTLTQGIVSARRDHLPGVGDGRIEGLLQTDAPINPGNSGGPLVDARGEVVGVNTVIISRTGGSDGIGFAVPSRLVAELVANLRRRARPRTSAAAGRTRQRDAGSEASASASGPDGDSHPVWLGIEGQEFRGFGISGVRVQRVIPGGPAAAAGLRGAGDPAPRVVRRLNVPWTGYVILAMDGQPVRGWGDLRRLLSGHQPGDRTTLTVTVPPGQMRGDTVVELAAPPRTSPAPD